MGGGRKWRNGSSRGGHGGGTGGGGGGGKRGRVFRRDFGKGEKENVWKKPRTDGGAGDGAGDDRRQGDGWAGFQLENAAFEEYYKVREMLSCTN